MAVMINETEWQGIKAQLDLIKNLDPLVIAELRVHEARMRLEAETTETRRRKHPNITQRIRLAEHRDRLNKIADQWSALASVAS